jgi:hypothetical protein
MYQDVFATAVVFFGFYHIIKLISEHILKGRIIKAGPYRQSRYIEPPKPGEEVNKYPSLKWGLVALMTGLGFIVIEVMRQVNPQLIDFHNAALPAGILLVFISLGFLIYFFMMNRKALSS